jgi:glucuronoarabinoxylan endo-1,4-beta-xylanase
MAQYSRFVRPGWRVVSTQGQPGKGVFVTTFADPSMRKFAAVVVNTNRVATKLDLDFKGARRLRNVNVFRTSESENAKLLGATPGPITSLSGSVEASSVTTYYGDLQR